MRTAWILPGQGSLRTGATRAATSSQEAPAELASAASTALDAASAVVGRDLRAVGDDPEAGSRTADAQPAIAAASLAAAAALRAAGLRPDLVAGHSLGECTAAIVAGALTLDEGVQVIAERGAAMGQACAASPGTMAALVKLSPEAVEALLADHPDVVVANDNAPGQVVVAGPPDPIAELRAAVRQAGGRLVPLPVEGAFHSPAMASAEAALTAALAAVSPATPTVPLLSGVDVALHRDGSAIADRLVDGLLRPVRWREVQLALAAEGVTHLIEVGPGGVLAGLAARTVPDLQVHTVATPADADTVATTLLAATPVA